MDKRDSLPVSERLSLLEQTSSTMLERVKQFNQLMQDEQINHTQVVALKEEIVEQTQLVSDSVEDMVSSIIEGIDFTQGQIKI